MRHTRTEKMNHDHYAKVVVARRHFNDAEDAKVIRYVETTPEVVSHMNESLMAGFNTKARVVL
jgi:hypothetical protein